MIEQDKEVLYLLSRCEGVGPITMAKLLAHVETPAELMHPKAGQLLEMLGKAAKQAEPLFGADWRAKRLAEREKLELSGVKLLYKGAIDYPPNLMHIPDAPVVLYAFGQTPSFNKKYLSIVGTRAMTVYAKKILQELLANLDVDQVTIVSGLAKGVDACAQSLALEMGFYVISVVAHGLDRTYPRDHLSLRRKIEKRGCTYSEFFNGVKPLAGHFVARNRIIAGLSDATLIVESAQSGGSLTTAHFAFGYERSLFAVPGRLTDRFSLGCNRLIGELKAQLYAGPETLIEALQLRRVDRQKSAVEKRQFKADADKTLFAYLLKNGRAYPSQLLRHVDLEKQQLYAALLTLTLEGAIVHHNDNSYEVL